VALLAKQKGFAFHVMFVLNAWNTLSGMMSALGFGVAFPKGNVAALSVEAPKFIARKITLQFRIIYISVQGRKIVW
jgi:hypothetical protein